MAVTAASAAGGSTSSLMLNFVLLMSFGLSFLPALTEIHSQLCCWIDPLAHCMLAHCMYPQTVASWQCDCSCICHMYSSCSSKWLSFRMRLGWFRVKQLSPLKAARRGAQPSLPVRTRLRCHPWQHRLTIACFHCKPSDTHHTPIAVS